MKTTCLLVLSMTLVCLVTSAPEAAPAGDDPAQADVDKDSAGVALLDLQAWSEPPDAVAWNRTDAAIIRVTTATQGNPIALPTGEGCLVLLRKGAAPHSVPSSLAPSSVTALPPLDWRHGSIVRGSIADPDGIAVGGASVRATLSRPPGQKGEEEQNPACTSALAELGVTAAASDSRGVFTVGPLAVGRYELGLDAPGFAPRTLMVSLTKETDVETSLGEVTLVPAVSLRVTVVPDDIDEAPPFDLSVQRESEEYLNLDDRWVEVAALEVGVEPLVIQALPPGLLRIVLSKEGSDLLLVQVDEFAAGDHELVLHPRPIFVRGSVTESEHGVEGAEVIMGYEQLSIHTVTNQDGEFSLRVWTPAEYGLFVKPPEGGTVMEHRDLRDAEPGDEVRIDIELPTLTIEGTVVSSEDQAPIAGAELRLDQKFPEEEAASSRSEEADANGEFSFERVKPSPSARIEARAGGFLPKSLEVDAAEGGAPEVWIELDPADVVKGRIVGEAGEPVAAAQVACCVASPESRFEIFAVADANGEFTLSANDGVTVFANAAGYALGWGRASVEQRCTVVLGRLPAPTWLTVKDSEGTPMIGGVLTFRTADGVMLPFQLVEERCLMSGVSPVTDADGRVAVVGLPPGMYEAWIRTASGSTPLSWITIPSSTEIVLLVPEG